MSEEEVGKNWKRNLVSLRNLCQISAFRLFENPFFASVFSCRGGEALPGVLEEETHVTQSHHVTTTLHTR